MVKWNQHQQMPQQPRWPTVPPHFGKIPATPVSSRTSDQPPCADHSASRGAWRRRGSPGWSGTGPQPAGKMDDGPEEDILPSLVIERRGGSHYRLTITVTSSSSEASLGGIRWCADNGMCRGCLDTLLLCPFFYIYLSMFMCCVCVCVCVEAR